MVAVTKFVLIVVGLAVVLVVVVALLLRWALRRLSPHVVVARSRVLDVRTRFLPPGPRRDAALLRQRLNSEMRSTADMLERAPDGVVFRADARSLLQDLVTTAAEVDAELAAIERFLDPAQQRAALTAVTGQVRQLIDTTYTARHTILRTAAEDRSRQLAALQATVTRQAAALETYQKSDRELRL